METYVGNLRFSLIQTATQLRGKVGGMNADFLIVGQPEPVLAECRRD